MQTIPYNPIPYEPYDSYAYRLLTKRNRKATETTHKVTRLEVEAEKWFFAFLLTLLNVAIWFNW